MLRMARIARRWTSFAGMLLLLLILPAACKTQHRTANPLVGEWTGVLHVDGKTHQSAMRVRMDQQGNLSASLDAVDEHVMGLQATNVVLHGNDVSFDVPVVNGKYQGAISSNGGTITGIWTKPPQTPSPLVFTRQPDQPDDADENEP